ncbi:MAG: hypothetical protein Kow0069_10660 [Promethearchaeota archaeon]
MNPVARWHVSGERVRYSAVDMRERSAVNYHMKVLADDDRFDAWVNNFRHDCLRFLRESVGVEIGGVVVEIGAGTGIYSCLLSRYQNVKKVYVLDYSPACVERLFPFVASRFGLSEGEMAKLYPVVGSFDEMELPDESVDFVVAFGALHHSEDRHRTLEEVYRVLKLGGYLVAVDRAAENTTTNAELAARLDVEYSAEFKRAMGYEPDQRYTRRMNSEHEPLMAEWEYLLSLVGFKHWVFWFKKSHPSTLGRLWRVFAPPFFHLFGNRLARRRLTQLWHAKIPYYPWFSKAKNVDDVLILAKKLPYVPMP